MCKINKLLDDIITKYNIKLELTPIYKHFLNYPFFINQFEDFQRRIDVSKEDFEKIEIGDYVDTLTIRETTYHIKVLVTGTNQWWDISPYPKCDMIYQIYLSFIPCFPLTSPDIKV